MAVPIDVYSQCPASRYLLGTSGVQTQKTGECREVKQLAPGHRAGARQSGLEPATGSGGHTLQMRVLEAHSPRLDRLPQVLGVFVTLLPQCGRVWVHPGRPAPLVEGGCGVVCLCSDGSAGKPSAGSSHCPPRVLTWPWAWAVLRPGSSGSRGQGRVEPVWPESAAVPVGPWPPERCPSLYKPCPSGSPTGVRGREAPVSPEALPQALRLSCCGWEAA